MRPTAIVLLLAVLLAPRPAGAAGLPLPVHAAGTPISGACYAGDVIEVQLAPSAARVAHPPGAGPTRSVASARLGLARLDALAAQLGASYEPEFAGETAPERAGEPDFTGFHLVHLPPGASVADALERYRALPEVVSASPLAILPVSWFPADSLFPAEHWLYRDVLPRHDIRAPEAWDLCRGDTSIVVAILDTGVLAYHPDLGGGVAGQHGNLWVNWAEAGGAPGVDDDGDGYVDDAYGWDFVTGGAALAPAAGEDTTDPDNDPNDYAGHGTLVAGIVGALTNNVHGLAGVAPTVRLMPVRVGWETATLQRPEGVVRMDFVAQGIRYATRKGASVINCSFETAYDAGLDSAVTAATAAGVTVVVASGNNGGSQYLGTRDDVISVAACDSNDVYASSSNTAPWLDLAADGVRVTSTYIQTTSPDSIGRRQPAYGRNMTGTSFAAPQVSAAVALLQAYAKAQGHAAMTPREVLLRLTWTADSVAALNPSVADCAPRLNLYRALHDPPGAYVSVGMAPRARGLALSRRGGPGRAPVTFDWSTGGGGTPVLALFDVLGRRVREVPLAGTAGSWTWDGRDGESRSVPAGLIFARLSLAGVTATARVVLLR